MQTPARTPAGGITTSQSPPFSLPIRYMLLGMVGFIVFAVDLVVQSSGLNGHTTFLPNIVALTHLLTLGSLLAFVMGAVYQLSTVAFLIPIKTVALAKWNFWLYGISIVGLIVSMMVWWVMGLMVFGTLAVIAIYLYSIIIIWSISVSKVRGAMQWFVLSAHIYLIVAVSLALLLIISFLAPGFLANVYQPLLLSHIVFAAGGFFTFLVMGFSFKLLPMFTLSHGFSTSRQKWTLILAHVALWAFVFGIWLNLRNVLWIAGIIAIATFINHLFDLRGIMKKRLRKKTEAPIYVVLVATSIGGFVFLLLFVQLGVALQITGWQEIVTFYLMGWVTLTVMGFAYKIIPFLIWNERFSKKVGKEKTPMIADLLHPNRARPVLIGFLVGLVLLTVFSLISWMPGTMIGTLLIGVSLVVFSIQLLRVVDLKKVGKEL